MASGKTRLRRDVGANSAKRIRFHREALHKLPSFP
jgi:hypothetical protein